MAQALYPTHFGVFVRAAEEWSDSPDVTTSLMKFMMEFVYNKVHSGSATVWCGVSASSLFSRHVAVVVVD